MSPWTRACFPAMSCRWATGCSTTPAAIALDQMMEGKPSLATLKTRVEDYKPAATTAEGGVVISSADGIVQVEGMDRAVYGEIVTFENGAKGMVESVDPGKLGIMLFDGAETVGVGTMVTRSGKRAGIPVGDAFLGRVIDPLGEPIDGKGPINAVGYNPIEKQAPAFWSARAWIPRCTPASSPSTPCSPSAAASVS